VKQQKWVQPHHFYIKMIISHSLIFLSLRGLTEWDGTSKKNCLQRLGDAALAGKRRKDHKDAQHSEEYIHTDNQYVD